MSRGRYVVLEGGEGVGKDTQARILIDRLQDHNIPAIFFEEPGGDSVGQVLRSLLKKDPDDQRLMKIMGGTDYSLLPKTEMFLFNAARVQALALIEARLAEGTWAICSRNFLSTIAYQCYGRGLDLEAGRQLCRYATEELPPDLMLVLSAPTAETRRRRAARQQTDQFEAAGEDFHERVNTGYRMEAEQGGIPVIDANGTPEEVHARIWEYVQAMLGTSK